MHGFVLWGVITNPCPNLQFQFKNTVEVMTCMSIYTIMMMSSNGNIFHVTDHLCGEFTVTPYKGLWHWASMFSFIFAWLNGWVNSHEAGYFRHQHVHYDVTVMMQTTLLYNYLSMSQSQINSVSKGSPQINIWDELWLEAGAAKPSLYHKITISAGINLIRPTPSGLKIAAEIYLCSSG